MLEKGYISWRANVLPVETGLIFDIPKSAERKGKNIELTPSSVLIMEPFISLET